MKSSGETWKRVERWLEGRWTLHGLGAAALAWIALPIVVMTLNGSLGYAADDFWHVCAVRGCGFAGGPTTTDLFRFASGEPRLARDATWRCHRTVYLRRAATQRTQGVTY